MDGVGHLQKQKKNNCIGILLLLMCMTASVFTQQKPEEKCQPGEFLTDKGICCNLCHAGFKLKEECQEAGKRSNCTICPPHQYTDHMNSFRTCQRCRTCKDKHNEIVKITCETNRNAVCECKDGYYKSKIDSQTSECLRCTPCRPDEREIQKCTVDQNTVCGCQENHHKVEGKCEPCKNCTEPTNPSETLRPSKGPDHTHYPLIGVIVAAFSGVLVLLLLVIFITYVATKRRTKKKMRSNSSQPSRTSFDSCQVTLFSSFENSEDSSVKAIAHTPVGEQEPVNLPDCIPLEIKMSDLIYTVLDLVPVQQMKQLVRSLGLRDMEIEQAEMDHRSCKEAHYQMLRMWAERSPCTGRRGHGGMLHRPLLKKLVDTLRQIHLGYAAEELETKYGIQ